MVSSERGRIKIPDLDDRTWQDLVDEAKALIPTYAPEWTDHNPSDLGITLIELFAYLVEGLIYRLNRVPEKNYIAFLNLLGVTRDPVTPAQAFLTFRATPSPAPVPKGTQAQTQGTEVDAPIVFETDESITVLPINLTTALLIQKDKYENISTSLTAAPANGHMLKAPSGQTIQLCLGFDKKTDDEITLRIQLFRPARVGKSVATPTAPVVKWVYSTTAADPASAPRAVAPSEWPDVPGLQSQKSAASLQQDGTIGLKVPPNWSKHKPANWNLLPEGSGDLVDEDLYWIGIRITPAPSPGPQPDASQRSETQIGVARILFNSASSHNALTIPDPTAAPMEPERLGHSNGKPFQVFALQNRPLFKRPNSDSPYDHLSVMVDGEIWTQVDDLPAGRGKFYRLEPVAGEITFGNFDPASSTGHGSIPESGRPITATYRYAVGGASGNVGAGSICSMRTRVDRIIGVTNLASSIGASDEEPIEEALRRAPEVLRNRYRAVTAEDYEYLAREATTDVAIVRCLPPRLHEAGSNSDPPGRWSKGDPWVFADIDRSPGNVNVIIVPDLGWQESHPEPNEELIREVQSYLDKRRTVTARLKVTGPRYLRIGVKVEVRIWPNAIREGLVTIANVESEILNRIKTFFHPTRGGRTRGGQLDARGWLLLDGNGWQVGENLIAADLRQAIMPPGDIGFILELMVDAKSTLNSPRRPFTLADPNPDAVRVTDYELICLDSNAVKIEVKEHQGG